MKRFLFLSLLTITSLMSFAQSEKYLKNMEKLVVAVDTTWNTVKLIELANTFERIADAEKTQWLPYYYAALSRANAGYSKMNDEITPTAEESDAFADKSLELIAKAEALTKDSKDQSEINIVKKLAYTLRMLANPMTRYMTDGKASADALAKAKTLNPENPRVYLQEGIDKMNTPAQFGGSVEEGKKLLETAKTKFEAFKPASTIHPSWGMTQVKIFSAK